MANEKTPVVWDDTTNKHRPLGTGEKMGGLDASSILSSDAGNLITSGSDGLAYASGSGIADPAANNLIETSDQGRLIVTADRIAEWIRLHPSDAADLASSLAPGLSTELADGKTIVASGGKLTVDPTNATAAQKTAINSALADADSGLVVDPSTGKLQVDFSNMPTDRFEDLLKGLKMQVPLDRNISLYVSTTSPAAGDDIVDGRGTAAKPFKTIQACVNYATSTYSLGRYSITIRVVAGTYNENVSLPAFDRGTGIIIITADSGTRDVIVVAQPTSDGYPGYCFNAGGGVWRLVCMDARRTERPNMGTGGVGGCYAASGAGTELQLCGCSAVQAMPSGTFGGNSYDVRVIAADGGGRISFRHGPVAGSITTDLPADTTTPSVNVVDARRGSVVYFEYSNNQSLVRTVDCYGTFNYFIRLAQASSVITGGIGPCIELVDHSTTGGRFAVLDGSFVSGVGGPSADFFPGSSAGVIDNGEDGRPQTYCWYR